MADQLPQYLSRSEAAEKARVTTVTIDAMIHDGRLKAYRFGRSVRIAVADFEAAMVPVDGGAA